MLVKMCHSIFTHVPGLSASWQSSPPARAKSSSNSHKISHSVLEVEALPHTHVCPPSLTRIASLSLKRIASHLLSQEKSAWLAALL